MLSLRRTDLALVLDNVHDPFNVSAIMRSCDAFGVGRVWLRYSGEAVPLINKKAAAASNKWVELVRMGDPAALVRELAGRGLTPVRADAAPDSRPLHEWDFTRPTAVILGNEQRGLEPELARLVPDAIRIPMSGMTPCLNVSAASAVILYEAWRQRELAGMHETPSIPEDERRALEDAWLKS